MIRAVLRVHRGPGARALAILGLVQGNVDRLARSEPILVDDVPLQLADGTPVEVLIAYGPTHADLVRTLREGGLDLPRYVDEQAEAADA